MLENTRQTTLEAIHTTMFHKHTFLQKRKFLDMRSRSIFDLLVQPKATLSKK